MNGAMIKNQRCKEKPKKKKKMSRAHTHKWIIIWIRESVDAIMQSNSFFLCFLCVQTKNYHFPLFSPPNDLWLHGAIVLPNMIYIKWKTIYEDKDKITEWMGRAKKIKIFPLRTSKVVVYSLFIALYALLCNERSEILKCGAHISECETRNGRSSTNKTNGKKRMRKRNEMKR